jgi:hypothetical protein
MRQAKNQLAAAYGSTAATDSERAAIPAHTAPAAFHCDWLVSAWEIEPAPSLLGFLADITNLLVADCSQNPAAEMENTQTLNCKESYRLIAVPFNLHSAWCVMVEQPPLAQQA